MIDLTPEQLYELYGYRDDDDDDDAIGWTDYSNDEWKPDFSKWVAIPQEDDCEQWMIAPTIFWDANGFIPDWCIGFDVPGFYEANEHTLGPKMPPHEARQVLIALGFTIIDNPIWGRDR